MRIDSTWKAHARGLRPPGEYVQRMKLTALSHGFLTVIPRVDLPIVDTGEIARIALEYSTDDGATWNLIYGFGIGGGIARRRDGSVSNESSIQIELLDTIHFQQSDPNGKLEDWYEVRSRALPPDTDLRLRIQTLVSLDFECDVHLEEGPKELKESGKLHSSVTFDATSSASGDNVTSLSWAHTCTWANRGFVVGLWTFPVRTPAVTYNSVSLTKEGEQSDPNVSPAEVEQHSLIAPATGANTVAVTWGGTSTDIVGGAVSVTGADQTDLARPIVTASGTGTAASVTATSAADELVVDVIENFNKTLTAGGGQTERWNVSASTSIRSGGSTEPGAASVDMGWTNGVSSDWAIAALSVKPAAVSGLKGNLALLGVGQ